MSTQEVHLKAIADAIREKEGGAAPIPAKAFADRILALPVGVESPSVTLPEASTQEEQLTRIAAAIRAKEGGTGAIPASRFAERIRALTKQTVSRLPEGYTEVEYVDIRGNVGISLGTTINPSTFRMVMDLSVYPYESGHEQILICNASGSQKTWIYRQSASSIGYMLRLADNDAYISLAIPSGKRIALDLDWKNQTITAGGIGRTIQNANYTTGTAFLFASTGAGGHPALPCRLYSVQIYKSGSLQKELVPCVQNSSGSAGLYDMSSNFFRTKGTSNTGTITPGPAV